jgi:phosphoglycerate dehydrogenase-like enzyme
MTIKVGILDDYQQVAAGFAAWSALPSDVEVTFFDDPLPEGPDLVERLAPFDVIGAMRERTAFPRRLLEQLPALRLLVTTGRRNSAIDTAAAHELGIVVSGTTSPGHATAELTMALLLSLARNIPSESLSVREGGWQERVGRDLRGATLGVVGLGRLGAQVATLGRAFGMDVGAWSHNLTSERCAELGVARWDRDELFERSDFITIHLRLSERTNGLVGQELLALMKPDAYLINTSRAPIVDEAALIRALKSGRIAGAALDVFDREPLPSDHQLRRTPRLLLTPHIGYVTRETYAVFYAEMVEAIAAYLRGTPIRLLTPEDR